MYNLLIGGAAGQGIETTAAILETSLKRSGYFVLTVRDFMSRVRGGHNFSLMRFGSEAVYSHCSALDGIVALDAETIERHSGDLKPDGFILCDSALETDDSRAIKLELAETAKQLGNTRVANTVALGALLSLFGEGLDIMRGVLSKTFGDKLADINNQAVTAGYDMVTNRYKHLDGPFGDHMVVSGSQAVAFGALAAGLQFYAAYPMSPSTPVMVALAAAADKLGIVVEQAEDEIAAMNMAIGGSYAGARAMTGTSGGGLSLMVEALGLAGITEIPVVVLDVMRPGPATGLPTRTEQADLKFVVSASQGEFPRMVIALRDHRDAFYQTVRAFDLAEKYQIPVILLSDQYLGDATSTVEPFSLDDIEMVQPSRSAGSDYRRYAMTESGVSPRLIPGRQEQLVIVDSDEHDEYGHITESAEVRVAMADKRMRKLQGLMQDLQEPEFFGPDAFDVLLIGWGSVSGPLKEAVGLLNAQRGSAYAALIFGDVWPLPTQRLTQMTKKAKTIINVEQNATGQLASLIRAETGIVCDTAILKYDGRQISGEEIAERAAKEAAK